MKTLLTLSLFLLACGEDRRPEEDLFPDLTPIEPVGINPGDGCPVFDDTDCPLPDASVDAAPEELPPDVKAACCHALLDGSPPNHECGYPPGLCKNGKKDMFCTLPDGTDAKFTLCNP